VWKVERAYDEWADCSVEVKYFRKKENAEKCLREWLKEGLSGWEYQRLDPSIYQGCKTWDDVLELKASHGGDIDIATMEEIKTED